MEIKHLLENRQEVESTTKEKEMRLSKNAESQVFRIFTENIYSNPIGTIVREITSNCFDSHIEAGVNSPVIIKKGYDGESNQHYISFIDFGVGMSPERIEDVYTVFFESSKRRDNTQIGGFGIGGKTPLAYKRYYGNGEKEYDNSFQIITIYNGIKYHYLIHEGKKSPVVTEIHRETTTEHNGTEVRVPILEKDIEAFSKEMVRQLYYFENIIFEGFENTGTNKYYYHNALTNDYKIVKARSFLFRGLDYSGYIHICLGRVAYPIDYKVLGLSEYDYALPVAIKLEIGEVGVTVSREQLDYSEATIKLLKTKLEEVKEEVTELLAKQYSNIVTLSDYFQVKNDFGKLRFPNGVEVNVGKLIEMKDVDFSNFKYNFMKIPNDKQLFWLFFTVKSYGNKPSRYLNYGFNGGYKELQSSINLLYIEGEEFNRKLVKQAYLKQQYGIYHIIRKRDLFHEYGVKNNIRLMFNVHIEKLVDENGKPTNFIQSILEMQEEYFDIVRDHACDYDKLEVPEEFIESRKRKKDRTSKDIVDATISVKYIGGSHRRCTTRVGDLIKCNMTIFYGTKDDEDKLSKAHGLFDTLFDGKMVAYYSEYEKYFRNKYNTYKDKSKKGGIMFMMIANGNVKYMQYCKKAYHVDQFYQKMLYRKEDIIMSHFQTSDLIKRWNNISSLYKCTNFDLLSDKWGKKINEIKPFIKSIKDGIGYNSDIRYYEDTLSKYLNLKDIKPTPEQKRIERLIGEVEKLEQKNTEIISCIRVPYYSDKFENKTLVEILKKVMVF